VIDSLKDRSGRPVRHRMVRGDEREGGGRELASGVYHTDCDQKAAVKPIHYDDIRNTPALA